MTALRIPASGRTLVAHLSAYGLALVLDLAGHDAFASHDASLDVVPVVDTPLDLDQVVECVRSSARACEATVERDLVEGKSGNDRRPVIWARATRLDRAEVALALREQLLAEAENAASPCPAALMAGLGAPAPWVGDKPHRGASRLDGVIGNHTSDFVRGALRGAAGSRRAAEVTTAEGLVCSGEAVRDKTGWSPPGTVMPLEFQWLAALGLGLLPVGLDGIATGRTPAFNLRRPQGITLPVLDGPVSVPRLRALLQAPELTLPAVEIAAAGAARLRALGVHEVVRFVKVDESNAQSVRFHFGRGEAVRL